jgi:hypothetical protein
VKRYKQKLGQSDSCYNSIFFLPSLILVSSGYYRTNEVLILQVIVVLIRYIYRDDLPIFFIIGYYQNFGTFIGLWKLTLCHVVNYLVEQYMYCSSDSRSGKHCSC